MEKTGFPNIGSNKMHYQALSNRNVEHFSFIIIILLCFTVYYSVHSTTEEHSYGSSVLKLKERSHSTGSIKLRIRVLLEAYRVTSGISHHYDVKSDWFHCEMNCQRYSLCRLSYKSLTNSCGLMWPC